MAIRKPLVVGADGLSQQLQAADSLGIHAKFTGQTTTPFSISLGATQTMLLTVTPAVAGDSLAAGEDVTVQPTAALPNGVNIAFSYVSATNQVAIGFTSSALISLSQTVNWRVTSHR